MIFDSYFSALQKPSKTNVISPRNNVLQEDKKGVLPFSKLFDKPPESDGILVHSATRGIAPTMSPGRREYSIGDS